MTELTEEQRIKAGWKKGVLNYKLKPWQHKLYNAVWDCINKQQSTYVVNCSRRYGKTFVLILIAIEFAIRHPKSQIKYAIPVGQEYIDMVLPSIEHIIEDYPSVRQKDPKTGRLINRTDAPEHNTQGKRIRFNNGSVIKFAGVNDDNAAGLRGNTSDLNIVDEAGFMNNLDRVYRTILSPQTLTTDGSTIFVSTPPETPAHDFATFYREHKENGRLSEFDIYSWANEKQIAKAIEESKGVDTTIFKREYLVQFVTETDFQLCSEWDDKYIIKKEDWVDSDLYPYYHKYVAMDMGTKDLTAILYAYYDFERAKLRVRAEYTTNGPEMTTEKLAAAVKAQTYNLWGKQSIFKYVADNNNQQMVNDLNITYGLPFFGTTKENDLDAMVNKVKVFVGQGKLEVHEDCKHLIGCLKFGVWTRTKDKTRGDKFAQSKEFGHYDGFAALMYLIRNIDTYTNPCPDMSGISHRTHSIPFKKDSKLSEQGKVINRLFSGQKRFY